jgi:hypothetical protein
MRMPWNKSKAIQLDLLDDAATESPIQWVDGQVVASGLDGPRTHARHRRRHHVTRTRREPAVADRGLLNIGAAFWGLLAGLAVSTLLERRDFQGAAGSA